MVEYEVKIVMIFYGIDIMVLGEDLLLKDLIKFGIEKLDVVMVVF